MIRVLVADDHALVRAGIIRLLEDEDGIEVVGSAESCEEAVEKTRELNPHVVLIDMMSRGIGCLEAVRRICRIDEDIRCIVLAESCDDLIPPRIMHAGASGYLTKCSELEELIRAIRITHSGQRYLGRNVAQKLALKPFEGGSGGEAFEALSDRELQIALMIIHCRRVSQIADELCISSKTVNSYRYRIFEKLDVGSDVELAMMAVRCGIVDVENSF